MLAWFRRGGVAEQIKLEWGSTVVVNGMKRRGQMIASFRPSMGWKIEVSAIERNPTPCECDGTTDRLWRNELTVRKMHLSSWVWSVLSSKGAADFVDAWCFSRRSLKETLAERSNSTKWYLVVECNVSACGKDILSGMHDEMNSWNVLTIERTGRCMTKLLFVIWRPKTLLIRISC